MKKKKMLCGFIVLYHALADSCFWGGEELSPPEYRCTIDNTDEDYASGDWKYGFTVEEEPLFYLKEGEKHVFLLCDGNM